MPKPTIPAGIATRRSRRGCVITSPRLRSGVPVSQLKTNGTSVRGTSRSSRSSRIHDQLLATVVRKTAGGLIRVIDDLLGRIALGGVGHHWRGWAFPHPPGSARREDPIFPTARSPHNQGGTA